MNSTEFQLLCLALRIEDQDEALNDAQKIIESRHIRWDDVYDLACAHSVRPQLAQLVNQINPAIVPEYARERLNAAYRKNVVDQLSHISEFLHVNHILKEAGIVAVPFKGFWLAHDVYGDAGARESVDVDLLIDVRDLERIRDLMVGMGYVAEAFFSPYTLNEIKARFGEYNFDRFENGVRIFHFEYHWRITSPVYGIGICINDLASQIVTGRIQGRELSVFTPSAGLLLAVMHHGCKDPFIELKQVLDVAAIIHKYQDIDWKWVEKEANKHNAGALIPIAIRLATEVTGIGVPEAETVNVATARVKRITNNRLRFMAMSPEKWGTAWFGLNDWIFRIRSRTGVRIKLRLIKYIVGIVMKRYLVPHSYRR